MRKSRFSESQIVSILKEAAAGYRTSHFVGKEIQPVNEQRRFQQIGFANVLDGFFGFPIGSGLSTTRITISGKRSSCFF